MANHEYTRSWSGTVGRYSAYGTVTKTIPAFSVPAGEKFVEFKCTSTGGLVLCGNMSSIGWNKWTTKKSYISWTDGSKSKVAVKTSTDANKSATIGVVFKTTDLPRNTLTCATSGSGTLTASTNSAYSGQVVTLTATPSSGWRFDHYVSSAGGTFSGNSFTMPDNATTVTAVFTQTTVSVNVVSEDSTKGTVTGGGKYSPNSTFTIKATPKPGYKFSHWTTTGGWLADENQATTQYTVWWYGTTITAHFVKSTSAVGRYDGTAFEPCELLYYDGESFKPCEVWRYNGSAWERCSNT